MLIEHIALKVELTYTRNNNLGRLVIKEIMYFYIRYSTLNIFHKLISNNGKSITLHNRNNVGKQLI